MSGEDQDLMAYIDGEVRAVCEAVGWGHQVRRRWSVRETPVCQSPIDDYEWKLIPGAHGKLPDAPVGDFEGRYYVLRFDKRRGRFVFQHDTLHCGMLGPQWEQLTYTEIQPGVVRDEPTAPSGHPHVGWLRRHLLDLTTRFGLNSFCIS